MSKVKFTRVRNKISLAIRGGKGITAHEATMRADAALEVLRIPCIETIEEALAQIERRFGAAAPGRDREPLTDLYMLSSRIIDLSGFLPDTGVDEAARALCEIVDVSISTQKTRWDAIDVSVRALQLLRTHGQSFGPERCATIINGLRDVVAVRATTVQAEEVGAEA